MLRSRVNIIFTLTISAFALLVGRFAYIQLSRHDFYNSLGDRQHYSRITYYAKRGNIVDARGRVLAQSVSVPSLFAIPSQISNAKEVADLLSPILQVDNKKLFKRLSSKRGFVYLKRHIDVATLKKVKRLELSGVHLKREPKRFYPNHYLASQTVGIAGIDNNGLSGLELKYDTFLRGTQGCSIVTKDARARKITFVDRPLVKPHDGQSIGLTIDLALQQITQEQLQKIGEKFKPISATAVVMEVDTGKILSMASWPSFDPNNPGHSPVANRRNIAITDVFEPGSTFKSFIAAAVMDRGLAKRTDEFNCENGAWHLKSRILHDHHSYGNLTLEDIIVKSSNIGAAKLGFKIGKKNLYNWVKTLGFGKPTGIELPGESAGLVNRFKHWSYFSMLSVPMGHEIGLTPIQLITAYASMVNGGVQVKPLLVEKLLDEQGRVTKRFPPKIGKRLISEKTSAELRKILLQVVERGTAKRAKLNDYTVGGKTGTSQKLDKGKYSHSKYYASFVGFAPVQKPKIVVLIGVNEPHGSHYGGTVAAPYVGRILQESLYYLRVPPQQLRDLDKVGQ